VVGKQNHSTSVAAISVTYTWERVVLACDGVKDLR